LGEGPAYRRSLCRHRPRCAAQAARSV